ncbi:phosphatidylethanolamine-binding protein [Phellopilus nigrolimitatus]|nr:phosphatidylethanolamine-binding protein [Phellopilus nigrolimitatus]
MPLLDPLSSIAATLRKDNVIPDLISEDFRPSVLFSLSWGDKEALLGNELTKADTQGEPNVQLTPMGTVEDAEGGSTTFTLAMVDPDMPSHADPKFSPVRHWLISGLKSPTTGEVLAAASAETELLASVPDPLSASSTKPAITPYFPPSPSPGTGMHRYVFLLFQEPSGGYTLPIDAPEFGAELEQRLSWSGMDFAKRHKLTLVGANYFTLFSE